MLPGFRFLFAAIVLSMSILVFGLGAAALLRAAHEQFASNPAWHAAPEATFAQQAEPTRPVLAILRVEPPPEPERVAALKPEGPALPVIAKPDIPVAESPAQDEAAPAQNDAPAAEATKAAMPAAPSEAEIASTTQVATEPVAQASVPASPHTDTASTKTAMLDSPSVTVEANPQAKAVSATPDQSVNKERLRARRAAHRRRLAARARMAARLAAQQPVNPFAPPFAQPPAVARR